MSAKPPQPPAAVRSVEEFAAELAIATAAIKRMDGNKSAQCCLPYVALAMLHLLGALSKPQVLELLATTSAAPDPASARLAAIATELSARTTRAMEPSTN